MSADPFEYAPELRDHLTPFAESFFRQGLGEKIRKLAEQHGLDISHFHSDAVRDGLHADFMRGQSGDIWIFAYGSLIWDPALDFAEVRRAHLPGYARRMCLYDDKGARGMPDNPGLMAGLLPGEGCDGVAFRITADKAFAETNILWQREIIAPGYIPTMLPMRTEQGDITALAFLADPEDAQMRPDLSFETQAAYIASGAGVLGTSFDYVKSILDRFALLGIEDRYLSDVFRRAQSLRA